MNAADIFKIESFGEVSANSPESFLLRTNRIYIEIIEKGSVGIETDRQLLSAEAGDVFVSVPSKTHRITRNISVDYKAYSMTVYGSFILHAAADYRLSNDSVAKSVNLKELYDKLIKLQDSAQTPDEKINNGCLIFLEIIQNIFMSQLSKPKRNNENLHLWIKAYIDRNIHWNININHICDALYCSKSVVIRNFKKTYGITPYQYIQQLRAETMKHMLRTTDISIDGLAREMHMSSGNYLIQNFKSVVGMTPAKYREMCRKENKTY